MDRARTVEARFEIDRHTVVLIKQIDEQEDFEELEQLGMAGRAQVELTEKGILVVPATQEDSVQADGGFVEAAGGATLLRRATGAAAASACFGVRALAPPSHR